MAIELDAAGLKLVAEAMGIRNIAGMLDGNVRAFEDFLRLIASRKIGGILAHRELRGLLLDGVIQGGRMDAVGASSIDIHLGDEILIEEIAPGHVIDYRARTQPKMTAHKIGADGFVLGPGQFILAHSVERLSMPDNLSAMLRTKSSMGRVGWEHMDAGFVDAGFYGALTLEFKNNLESQSILIRPGDPCGQLVFFEHEPVPDEASYAARGRYNGSATVEQVR